MAAAAKAKPSPLAGIRKRELVKALNTDQRVRDWLASGAVLGVKQAAEVLGVERGRIWRWKKEGKVTPLFDTGATELYMRHDLERMLREDPPQRRHRRNGDVQELMPEERT